MEKHKEYLYLTEQQKKMIDEVLEAQAMAEKCLMIIRGGSARIVINISKNKIPSVNLNLNLNEK